MQRKPPHHHHHHHLLLLLLSFCLMCEGIGSDSGPSGSRSSPVLDGLARVAFPKRSERVRRDASEVSARRKRSWIFPGTLWCGMNSKAATYEELGMFEDADRCCREHDHCTHIIPSFTVNYGVFNSRIYTLSHCDCDQRFRRCLLDVNDTISSMVGYSFFNILRVPCFELKQQWLCTKMHWWGMCKVSKEAPYAVLKSPRTYNKSDVTSKHGEDDDGCDETSSERPRGAERPMITPQGKSSKKKHRCRSKDPTRGDTFYRRMKGKLCKKLCAVMSSQMPQVSRETRTTTAPMETHLLNATKNGEFMPSTKRAGRRKSDRKGQVLVHMTTATQSVLPSTQNQKLHLHLPAATKTSPVWVPCTKCLEQETTPETTTVATATHGPPVNLTTLWTTQLKTKQERQKTLWNTDVLVKTRPKTAATLPREQVNSRLRGNNTNWRIMGKTTAQGDCEEQRFIQNDTILVADYHLLCGSLKHLDECRFQIPALEKKYGLQNKEPKTVYHCDCTTRFAVSIRRFKRPSVLPTLLMDFVSQRCFKTPKGKKCRRRKSCFGGFSKASDLVRALKTMEERKDAAGLQHSGHDRKRIPVRLYKRCLKLESKAETVAQLT